MFFGKSALESALTHTPGYGWVLAVLVLASALTAGAILRVSGRVFAGWGPRLPRHHELLSAVSEQPETLSPHDRTPAVMIAAPVHSGCVNDYIAWLVFGLAVIGGALALT